MGKFYVAPSAAGLKSTEEVDGVGAVEEKDGGLDIP
jgi:hypothetical protein